MAQSIAGQSASIPLPFEPLPAFYGGLMQNDAELANCQGKRIGILIVACNAVPTLAQVLRRITPNVWQNVEEVAVFDDASHDGTFELAVGMKAMRDLPKLHVLHHEKNLGYGGNQKAGYRYFMDKGFDIVVLLHGDGQYASELLANLYHPLVTGEAQAVFGSRMMKTDGRRRPSGMPLYKYLGNRILTYFESRSLGLHLTEFHSGYRAYDLHALRRIRFDDMTDDFHFDTEIIIKLHHQRLQIAEVPIPAYDGHEIGYSNGVQYARNVARAVSRYKQTCNGVHCFPEFQEYFVKFPLTKVKGSRLYYLPRMLGAGQEVIDIGCGDGSLGAALKKMDNRVTGIDAAPAAGKGSSLDRYFSADLDNGIGPVVQQLNGERFTRALLLDVVEHLKHPDRLLDQCHEVLEKDGLLILSARNVAHIGIRLPLLFGNFKHRDHLRFYTRRTLRKLVESRGYRVLEEKMTVKPFEPSGNPLTGFRNAVNRILTRLFPGLFGYETMIAARPQAADSDHKAAK